MGYDVGQTIRTRASVTDEAGAPINATMALTVTRPDGTTVAGLTVQNAGTGEYYADFAPDSPGPWSWRWVASGSVAPAVFEGQAWVRIPGPRIVSLEDIKKHLNKSLADTTDDDELLEWIDAARWVIENIAGPVVPRTVTEDHDGGGRLIRLKLRPVQAVTSVVVNWGGGDTRTLTAEPTNGVGLTDNQYLLTPAGLLYHRANGWTVQWPYGQANVRVVYVAGRYVPADNLRQAAKELITHGWRQSQLASGGTRPRTDGPDPTSLSYGVPNRVRELLGGQKRAPRLGR